MTDEKYSKINNIYYAFLNWTVVINEAFEIQQFPFDRQILKCNIYSNNCMLVSWDPSIPVPPGCPEGDLQFVVMYSYTNWILNDVIVEFDCDGEHGPWEMHCSVLAARVPDFYLVNIVGIIFVIVLFAASVYAIPASDFAARVSVNLTLLLTAVAFKFVTNSWVPQVSYLTLLDKYTIVAILMLVIQVLENFVVSLNQDEDDNVNRDKIFAIVFTVVWVAFHIYILIGSRRHWFCDEWDKVLDGDDSAGSCVSSDHIPQKLKSS